MFERDNNLSSLLYSSFQVVNYDMHEEYHTPNTSSQYVIWFHFEKIAFDSGIGGTLSNDFPSLFITQMF